MSNETSTEAMTAEQVAQLVTNIKGLVSRSALAKIDIGILLNEHTSKIPHGEKEQFYKDIGISDRTAQHYMKIAGNKKVQELKAAGELEGLNMSEILKLAGVKREVGKKVELVLVSIENFNPKNCSSRAVLKAQYARLSSKVDQLQKELDEYKANGLVKTA